MTSLRTSAITRVLWWTLRALRAYSPELQAPFAHTLNRGDYTVVFWPIRVERIPLHPLGKAPTSTAKRSIWLLRRWPRLPTWVTRGNRGVAGGTVTTPSTLNSPEPPLERDKNP